MQLNLAEQQWGLDKRHAGGRNATERALDHLKDFRSIAIRYDRLAVTFLAVVRFWL